MNYEVTGAIQFACGLESRIDWAGNRPSEQDALDDSVDAITFQHEDSSDHGDESWKWIDGPHIVTA